MTLLRYAGMAVVGTAVAAVAWLLPPLLISHQQQVPVALGQGRIAPGFFPDVSPLNGFSAGTFWLYAIVCRCILVALASALTEALARSAPVSVNPYWRGWSGLRLGLIPFLAWPLAAISTYSYSTSGWGYAFSRSAIFGIIGVALFAASLRASARQGK